MEDNSEYKLLTISIKKPRKYGSVLNKDLTQRQNFITHIVQKDDTLQGLALKYNVSMEKIKRANNLWTSDSLFLRSTLNIPIDKTGSQEKNNFSNTDLYKHQTSDECLSNISSSLCASNSQFNNDCKISLSDLTDFRTVNQEEKSILNSENNVKNNSANLSIRNEESITDMFSRIDQKIKKSKMQIDDITSTSEIVNSQSDNNLFQLHQYGNSSRNQRQLSLHNNFIFYEIHDKHNIRNGRNVVYSLRNLQKEQDKIFEL